MHGAIPQSSTLFRPAELFKKLSPKYSQYGYPRHSDTRYAAQGLLMQGRTLVTAHAFGLVHGLVGTAQPVMQAIPFFKLGHAK